MKKVNLSVKWMRKIFSILVLTSSMSISSRAQNSNIPNFQFGVNAGVNLATIKVSGSGVSFSGNRTSLKGGAYGIIKLKDNFSIQPELLYSGLGGKNESYGDTIKLSYLQIPVFARYAVGSTGISLLAGPQIGFLFAAKKWC